MFNIAYKSTNVKSCTYKYLSARVDRPMLCDDMVFRDEYFAVQRRRWADVRRDHVENVTDLRTLVFKAGLHAPCPVLFALKHRLGVFKADNFAAHTGRVARDALAAEVKCEHAGRRVTDDTRANQLRRGCTAGQDNFLCSCCPTKTRYRATKRYPGLRRDMGTTDCRPR